MTLTLCRHKLYCQCRSQERKNGGSGNSTERSEGVRFCLIIFYCACCCYLQVTYKVTICIYDNICKWVGLQVITTLVTALPRNSMTNSMAVIGEIGSGSIHDARFLSFWIMTLYNIVELTLILRLPI